MDLGFRMHAERTPNPNSVKWVLSQALAEGGVGAHFPEAVSDEVSPLAARLFAVDGVVGVFVAGVVAGSPAETAGIRPGDRILAIDGQEVHAPEALTQLVRSGRPGDKIELVVYNDAKKTSVTVTLGRQPLSPQG